MSNYGIVVRKIRKSRKVSQFILEIECGFTPGMISRIENGQTNPTKETLLKIAIFLKLSEKEILDLFGINQIIKQYSN